MGKIREIFVGWKNLFFTSPEIKMLSDERMAVCAKCIHASATMYLHCEICGCYIPAKAKSPESDCPINLWNKNEIV